MRFFPKDAFERSMHVALSLTSSPELPSWVPSLRDDFIGLIFKPRRTIPMHSSLIGFT